MDRLQYNKTVNNLGRIMVFICVVAFMLPAFIISAAFKTPIDWGMVVKAGMPLFLTFVPSAIAENLSYAPILGSAGLFVACITGNLGNMKLPAAMNAMQLIDENPGSEKADLASVIAICSASVVTMCITTLGMIFLAPLAAPLLSTPALQPAFNNLVPALQGAILFPMLAKNPKAAIMPYCLALAALFIFGRSSYSSNQGFIMIGVILICVIITYLRWKSQNK
ncbi:MAG: hypothetical protein II971_07190 [Firmicutes bacterium]|nr:hypothetical protein [Bacillota bacterium]